MGLHDLNHPGYDPIQRSMFLPFALIGPVVLDGNRVGKYIVCQNFSIPVIDLSSGTGNINFLFDLHRKALCIILSMNDLQQKNPSQQNTKERQKDQHQYKDPGSYKINKRFFKIFKQSISSLFFVFHFPVDRIDHPVKDQSNNNRI